MTALPAGLAAAFALVATADAAQEAGRRPDSWTEAGGYAEGWLVAPGQRAREFALPDPGGALHRLSDFAGRPVLLVFWGSW
jgi:hypothetical protein